MRAGRSGGHHACRGGLLRFCVECAHLHHGPRLSLFCRRLVYGENSVPSASAPTSPAHHGAPAASTTKNNWGEQSVAVATGGAGPRPPPPSLLDMHGAHARAAAAAAHAAAAAARAEQGLGGGEGARAPGGGDAWGAPAAAPARDAFFSFGDEGNSADDGQVRVIPFPPARVVKQGSRVRFLDAFLSTPQGSSLQGRRRERVEERAFVRRSAAEAAGGEAQASASGAPGDAPHLHRRRRDRRRHRRGSADGEEEAAGTREGGVGAARGRGGGGGGASPAVQTGGGAGWGAGGGAAFFGFAAGAAFRQPAW